MNYKFFFILFSIVLALATDAKGYDLFVWSSSYGNASGYKILRFGPDDSLYIGSMNGLHIYKDSTVTHYRLSQSTNVRVNSIAFDAGITWLGTDKGLIKKTGGQIQVFNSGNSGIISNNVSDVVVGLTQIYIVCDSGLSVFDGFNWNNFSLSVLGLQCPLNSIGKNNFGLYIMDGCGNIVYNNGGAWNQVKNIQENNQYSYLYGRAQFRNLNNDTLLVPSLGAYLIDTTLKRINVPVDPCLFKDVINTSAFLISNPATGEKFCSVYNKENQSEKFLIKADNLQPDLSDSRILRSYQLGDLISRMIDNENSFDFDSSGKLYWIGNVNPRGVNSVYLSLDSFPVSKTDDFCPYLDINQVRARIMNNGGMFWDYNKNALYEVPKGSGKTAILCQGLWIGGLDPANQLHLAAQTYRQSGADFWPGPLDTISGTIDTLTKNNYDSIWKIERSTIDDFIWRYATGQVQNGSWSIPDIILNWPAAATGNYSKKLAPYYDFNKDGLYNPYDGDFPDIKGSQMIWSVFNDNFSTHATNFSDRNLGVEIHLSAYAYNCPLAVNDDSVINYTTFYHYEIINRSDTDYHEVYLGNFTDVDLGNYLDDYVGCDTLNNFAFAYNGNDDDAGPIGYGLHPPMINNVILKGPVATLNDGLDNDNDGIIDEKEENCMMNHFSWLMKSPGLDGVPNRAMDFYNRMKSLWLDGRHLTIGGWGYNPANTNYTNFMFPAIPYSGNFWSEVIPIDSSQTPNSPDDRKLFVASGPFDLGAHQSKSFDIAYVFTRDPNSPNGLTTSIARNTRDVLSIKQFYESNIFPCDNSITVNEINDLQFQLFPNPANKYIEIVFSNFVKLETQMTITDLLGQLLYQRKISYEKNVRFATENLAPGIYLIKIFSEGKSTVKKFIVRH